MTDLSTRKLTAVAAVLSNNTLEGAARAARVNPKTLARWLKKDEAFRAELVRQRSTVIGDVLTWLARASKDAVMVLHVIAISNGAPAASRVAASRSILELAIGLEDQRGVAARLAALEAAIAAEKQQKGSGYRWQ